MVKSRGRGRNYSRRRSLVEAWVELAYFRSWPAFLWGLWPLSRRVRLHEERLRLSLPDALPDAPPLRVAFLSDIHLGPTTPLATIESAFALARAAGPDVLILGGDFVYLAATPAKLRELSRLVESVPSASKFAVMGNHDLWAEDDELARALTNSGVQVLVNDAASLPSPHGDVAVIGLDDPYTGNCDATEALRATQGKTRLVVCHSPDGLGFLGEERFDLFLCGHTHGGQIAAPWGPIILPRGELCRDYPAGRYSLEHGEIFVSRGVGTVGLPFRFFAPPDCAIFELHPDQK